MVENIKHGGRQKFRGRVFKGWGQLNEIIRDWRSCVTTPQRNISLALETGFREFFLNFNCGLHVS